MAKFERRIKISLEGEAPEWKDSYIEVATLSHDATQKSDKEVRKLRRKLLQLEKQEPMSDEQEQEYEQAYDTLASRLIKLCKQQFREGKITSIESGELIDLTADDLGEFDMAVITQIAEAISGRGLSKKK